MPVVRKIRNHELIELPESGIFSEIESFSYIDL